MLCIYIYYMYYIDYIILYYIYIYDPKSNASMTLPAIHPGSHWAVPAIHIHIHPPQARPEEHQLHLAPWLSTMVYQHITCNLDMP